MAINLNKFLSSLPSSIFPYTVAAASMVLPTIMAPREQLLCSVSMAVFFEIAFIAVCIGLDSIGQKLGNLSPLNRFLDQPIESSSFNRFAFPIGTNAICGFAAPAA